MRPRIFRARLAPYKIPKGIEFRAELPLAFTGKVLRRVLAEEEARLSAPGRARGEGPLPPA
jgi:acyl-CoA synthetase (AMP-forming)/AMP-acid ligase II